MKHIVLFLIGFTVTAHAENVAVDATSVARSYFSNVALVDQDGSEKQLYDDLLKNKVVLISSFFLTCHGVCPPMVSKLKRVQEGLGDRLGKDIYLLSLTVDAAEDTPAKMKEFASSVRAKSGWFFLSGKKENVDWALYKTGQYVTDKDDHSTVFIIGNEATGSWKKVLASAPAEELIRMLEQESQGKRDLK